MNKKLAGLGLSFLAVVFFAGCDGMNTEEEEEQSREVALLTIVDDSIATELNPNSTTPLAAVASFTSNEPVRVEVMVTGPVPLTYDVESQGTDSEIPILGLYPDTGNEVVLTLTQEDGAFARDTLHIETAALPESFPDITVNVADTSRMEPGMTLSGFSVGNNGVYETHPFVFDSEGNVRWYMDLTALGGIVFPVQQLANGNLLTPRGFRIQERDWLGRVVNSWSLDDWQHHEVIEKPDGNLIVAVDRPGIGTVEDHILELDRSTGSVVREWDLRQILDMYRRSFSEDEVDWFHMNAVWYDEVDDALLISGRNQGVVKVTMQNELVWILAPHRGWGNAGVDSSGHDTSEFLLTAVNASGVPYAADIQDGTNYANDFDWTWGQHAVQTLPNGNVFLFDNGTFRNFTGAEQFSRAVEYSINEDDMTVEQVWEYGKDRGAEYYSVIISDVDYLSETENRLIAPGFINNPVARAMVTEITYPSEQVVFEATIDFQNLFGSGAGWGQSDIVYRSERIELRP